MKKILFFIICISLCITVRSEYVVNVISEDTGTDNGVVEVIANGRTGPYTVSIINALGYPDQVIESGTTTAIFPDLSAGDYITQITNVNGCSVELPFTVTTCPISVKLFLEGAYDKGKGKMNTGLNTRGMLPGQTPVGALSVPTPAGQPYNIAPWNYQGDEGAFYTDQDYEKYDEAPVDWVLMTVLENDITSPVTLFQAAGVLDQYGSFHFSCPTDLRPIVGGASGIEEFHVRMEHRNHMGIMTPEPIHFLHSLDIIDIDFRIKDSYREPTSFGQTEIVAGVWAMLAGDADQSDFPSYDVQGGDKQIWFETNGIFDNYLPADMNLDADVNGFDKGVWQGNNGKSSRVPKN